MFRRELVDAIGLPDASYFIFYDDVDYAVRGAPASASGRARRRPRAPARLQPAARPGRLEGFYMFRNLFVVPSGGENVLVRLRPYVIALAVVLLSCAGRRPRRSEASSGRTVGPGACGGAARRSWGRAAGSVGTSKPQWSGDPSTPSSLPASRPGGRRQVLRPGDRRIRLLRAHHRRALRGRAGSRVLVLERRHHLGGTPTARRTQTGIEARVRRAPLPHQQREGLGVRHRFVVPELPAPGLRPSTPARSTRCR